jgi:hypothetical protein
MESFIEPLKHLMGGFKTQPTPIQLDAITDDVDETESLPEEGFPNAGFEMVKVIDSCSGIKVRGLLGEDATQSKGQIRLPSGGGDRLCALRGRRSSLATRQSIDFVIIAENRDIRISPRGMEQMVPSNASQIPIS